MLIWTRKVAGTKPWAIISPHQEKPDSRISRSETEDETEEELERPTGVTLASKRHHGGDSKPSTGRYLFGHNFSFRWNELGW